LEEEGMSNDILKLLEDIEYEIVFNNILFGIEAEQWKTLERLRGKIKELTEAK
jgi:hypothetical protein